MEIKLADDDFELECTDRQLSANQDAQEWLRSCRDITRDYLRESEVTLDLAVNED